MPDDVPTFFFSHARQGRERRRGYLMEFFEDLKEEVAACAAVDLDSNEIGTIDTKVLQGENWDKELSGPVSTNKVFIAILSPIYFKRENCGKELFAFVQRSPSLGIDTNGALINVENVLPIRWYAERYYAINTRKNAKIPPILSLIEDTPGDEGDDPERTAAIAVYRKRGMENCVNSEPHYTHLLELFALRICELDDLPSSVGDISFATLHDAFTYDWRKRFAEAGGPVDDAPPSAPPDEQLEPSTLASVVAFYVTGRSFQPDPTAVDFADQLIAESSAGEPAGADSMLARLLADVRDAGDAERFSVFHAAADPVVSDNPRPLLDRLASLSKSDILTALVVDPTVWPASVANPQAADAVESIIRSDEWMGPVLLPSLDPAANSIKQLGSQRGLSRRIVELPQESEARVDVLRRTFVDERGNILRKSSTGPASDAEPPPALEGVSPGSA